jgi:glyoxylase-like metal-dependent hydrolase (beta-lactamase superfamily II)
MFKTYKAAPDIDVLTTSFPIPGLGFVPINAYVLQGPEPILVDSGPGVMRDEFLEALRSVIDPKSLRWLWLTHPDPDHTGALAALLAENPDLRIATTFLSVGMLGLIAPLPMDRVYLLNPGQKLEVGARTLTALRPPAFDNPATMGFYESSSGALFSSDCFGALLPEVPENASDLTEDGLRQGQVTWSTIDSPWLHKVAPSLLAKDIDELTAMEPKLVLSSHLPAASGTLMGRLTAGLRAVPAAEPFVGPDQAALMQMMAGIPG